mmetsp:Transcript_64678/g.209853  ORF Transcript_64678/g.209853 Transcript_64678/m.209853 type:complete len:262 (-) Transcript_64678:296-1081(-)
MFARRTCIALNKSSTRIGRQGIRRWDSHAKAALFFSSLQATSISRHVHGNCDVPRQQTIEKVSAIADRFQLVVETLVIEAFSECNLLLVERPESFLLVGHCVGSRRRVRIGVLCAHEVRRNGHEVAHVRRIHPDLAPMISIVAGRGGCQNSINEEQPCAGELVVGEALEHVRAGHRDLTIFELRACSIGGHHEISDLDQFSANHACKRNIQLSVHNLTILVISGLQTPHLMLRRQTEVHSVTGIVHVANLRQQGPSVVGVV